MYAPDIAVTARIGEYTVVHSGMVGPTRVGERTWLLCQVHVGHDCQIGDDCEVATGSVLAGHTVLENGARLGVGVVTRPGVRIGAGARVGAGAVVTKDVPAGELWFGNPAAPHGSAIPAGMVGGAATEVPVVAEDDS